jgi:ribonuclease E
MAKRMLIDATHPEETRVVVQNGHRLDEFDFESSTKKQVKGNIYLAKVTRVEPSLQAAFVDYAGNRHGFLAFSEIHPDYYRIPVSDRGGGEVEAHSVSDDAPDEDGKGETGVVPLSSALPEPVAVPEPSAEEEESSEEPDTAEVRANKPAPETAPEPAAQKIETAGTDTEPQPAAWSPAGEHGSERPPESPESTDWRPWEPAPAASVPEPHDAPAPEQPGAVAAQPAPELGSGYPEHPYLREAQTPKESAHVDHSPPEAHADHSPPEAHGDHLPTEAYTGHLPAEAHSQPYAAAPEFGASPESMALRAAEESVVVAEIDDVAAEAELRRETAADSEEVDFEAGEPERVEILGGDEVEEVEEADAEQRRRAYPMRHYKIQEVIKRRQIMLVQVAKEERGNKGAALTTYLSLAGRYCVLMPNTARGGGVSRKITSLSDRRRLKDILADLEIPEGMGVIVRTAGAERTKAEIKRDYEYLLRLWNEIRELTLKSTAPALIYEEGNLIKRAIRDLYTRDIDEVLVEGDEGYRIAKAFMRTLMPSHARRVQQYRDPQVSLFHRHQVESQIDAIHSPVAQLRSGGYVVINQTEALVAIDVNSGRSTRERNIEETALRTNLEAAEELARQLRLRDLSGLIVIDFIDMEEHRNRIAVERRLKEALKNDRARIQVGRISAFGLLEMSRQRLRPSLVEASTQPCPHCGGTGFIRSVESTALHVLRSIEEEGIRRRSAEICVYVPTTVALYILNQKRDSLAQVEDRYGLRVMVARDDALIPPNFRLDRLRAFGEGEIPQLPRSVQAPTLPDDEEEDEDEAAEALGSQAAPAEDSERDEEERGHRRRRRRRRRPDEGHEGRASPTSEEAGEQSGRPPRDGEDEGDGDRRRRRRGRRGGRVRGRRDGAEQNGAVAAETIEVVSVGDDEQVRQETVSMPELKPWAGDAGIEAASLAPMAGDSAETPRHGEHRQEHEQTQEASAPTAESEEGLPFVSPSEREFETASVDAPSSLPSAVEERAPETASAAPHPDPEPELAASEPAPAVSAADNVQTVTEKPENPRRGWWQRLTNS